MASKGPIQKVRGKPVPTSSDHPAVTISSDHPPRLFRRINHDFEVVRTRGIGFNTTFDIISCTWGNPVDPYNSEIPGVSWELKISPKKIDDIKRLMIHEKIEYLWVDCICLRQDNDKEMSVKLPKMYMYYRSARKCHVLMDIDQVWDPQDIVNNLKFIDHVLSNMKGTTLTPEFELTENMIKRLAEWETADWKFPLDSSIARAAAIDMGVLNCYSTCVRRVTSILRNRYFQRVWAR
jgi:heterokaryon incompatibility protein (HET)